MDQINAKINMDQEVVIKKTLSSSLQYDSSRNFLSCEVDQRRNDNFDLIGSAYYAYCKYLLYQ